MLFLQGSYVVTTGFEVFIMKRYIKCSQYSDIKDQIMSYVETMNISQITTALNGLPEDTLIVIARDAQKNGRQWYVKHGSLWVDTDGVYSYKSWDIADELVNGSHNYLVDVDRIAKVTKPNPALKKYAPKMWR